MSSLARWRKQRRKDRRQLRILDQADLVVVSFRKSGRTWLRAMVSHLYHQRHGVPEHELLEFDNFSRYGPNIPAVLFTHDLPWDPWNRWWRRLAVREPFRDKRLLLLVRDPRDAAASLYFQLARRQQPWERVREGLPATAGAMTVGEFLLDPRHGGQLARCIDFLNDWGVRSRGLPGAAVLRYEDLRTDPVVGLRRVASMLGGGGRGGGTAGFADEELRQAVAFADFDRLREREAAGFFNNTRLRPGDPEDPESFKVRRGKVGGWRDYVTPAEAADADALVAARLRPGFGYA